MTKRWLSATLSIFLFVLLCGSISGPLLAQNNNAEEIEVYLDFRHRGIINSVLISYYKNDEFYLPVSELFSLFNVDQTVNGLVIDGRFGVEQVPYSINLQNGFIEFGDERIRVSAEDYIIKEIDSYLRAEIFYKAFGLDFTIDFNNLSLNLETERELPAIQQALRRQRRRIADQNRLDQVKYPLKYDRERPFLDGGFVDYNLSANVNSNRNIYNFNTNLGLQLYGGDLQGSIFGSYSENFSNFATDNLRWRYMYRDQPWLTTLTIGQTTTDGFSRNAYTGIRLTNEPIEPRRLFDEFEVQGTTIPQSEVELYLNNALIDFQQSDELGFYRFLTPVSYGSSQLDLKIYGPTGQIIERSERIQVPFTFQPTGVFNYTINAGRLDNPIFGQTSQNLTAQGSGAYGISEWLTAKAGVEYYEGYHDNLPTFTASVSSRIKSNYILTLEAASEAYYRGMINVIYPNSASLSLDYTDYTDGFSFYNPSNDDKRLVASAFYPFRFWNLPFNVRASTFSRFRTNTNTTSLRLDLNSRINKLNLRVGYSDRYTDGIDLFNPTNTAVLETSATYNVSRNRNLPAYLRGVFLRGQLRYFPNLSQVESAEISLSQNVFEQGRLQLTYGRNFAGEYNSLRFNLVVDFNKVRTSSTYSNIRGGGNFTQNVRGSIGYDTNYNNFIFTSRDQVGRSGTAVKLFVDNNADGMFSDEDDPIAGNAIRIQRSGATSTVKNGVIYYTQMQPYFFYNMEMNKSLIQNPMLVPEFEKFGLITDPNRFKKIEIPFYMSGVVEGSVQRMLTDGNTTGVAGLRLFLTQQNGTYDKELRTFSDGSFYDYEIPPGNYTLKVDSTQLELLGVVSEPAVLSFEVERLPDGDFVEGLRITLMPSGIEREDNKPISDAAVITQRQRIQDSDTANVVIRDRTLGTDAVLDSLSQRQQQNLIDQNNGDRENDRTNVITPPPTILPPPPVTDLTDMHADSISIDSMTAVAVADFIEDDATNVVQDTAATDDPVLLKDKTDLPADSSKTGVQDMNGDFLTDSTTVEDPTKIKKDVSGVPPTVAKNIPPEIPADSLIELKGDSLQTNAEAINEEETVTGKAIANEMDGEDLAGNKPTAKPDSSDSTTISGNKDLIPILSRSDAIPEAFRSDKAIETLTPGRCIYGIQFASYSIEDQANELSEKLGGNFMTFTIYNTPYELFALREIRYQSLGHVAATAKSFNRSNNFEAAILSQCYADLELNPETNGYYVQIAKFATEENAQRYINELRNRTGIAARKMPGEPFDIKIGVGPFRTEKQATEQMETLRNLLKMDEDISLIRHTPPVKIVDLNFEFLLLLNEFQNQEQATAFSKTFENAMGIKTKVLLDENQESYFVTTRLSEGWKRVNNLKNRISKTFELDEPVILMVEKRN